MSKKDPQDIRFISLSTHFVDNGALDWVDKKSKRKQVLRERKRHGYSSLDWWNFSDYLLYLINRISTLVSEKKIVVAGEDTIESSKEVVRLIEEYNDFLYTASKTIRPHKQTGTPIVDYEITDKNMYAEIFVNREDVDQKTFQKLIEVRNSFQRTLEIFYKDILPNLPYVYSPKDPLKTYEFPRTSRKYGISKKDYDSAGSFFVHVLINGLDDFISKGHGYQPLDRTLLGYSYEVLPSEVGVTRWNRALLNIKEAMYAIEYQGLSRNKGETIDSPDLKATIDFGTELLLIHHVSLWD